MDTLSQSLYITYSNQKARDMKSCRNINAFDKVITLDNLIVELFEHNNFQIIIDEMIASSIMYKIIQSNHIKYFSYLNKDALSLETIYNFIVKCKRNNIAFEALLNSDKLDAIIELDKAYQKYKQENNLVDIADVEQIVLTNLSMKKSNNINKLVLSPYINYLGKYKFIYIDNFIVKNINYFKSYKQEMILRFQLGNPIEKDFIEEIVPKIIKPSNQVFDNIDEVKTAIKIARQLLESGENSDEILIVASDIQEYAPLYKLFLDEYELKGYSSIGTSLNSFYNSDNKKVKIALNQYKSKIESLSTFYTKLGLIFDDKIKENIKLSTLILDDKIGIEMTEPNQLVGLSKRYKHIIFIGTDINHFPPKTSDNFLYSYEDDVKYFYANNYFTSSQTQLNEIKRLSENLYIITASYSGKRELSASILIDSEFDDVIDISDIKSVSQLALENSTIVPNDETKEYYESISSEEFTKYDGLAVSDVKATHLSASQINKYLSCPLSYLYSNKIKLQAPSQDEEGFDVMEQGSLMHLCYELFGKYIKKNHVKTTDKDELYKIMYDISFEAYNDEETTKNRDDENIHHQIFLSTLQSGLQDDRTLGLLAKFVDYYIENAHEFDYFKNSEFEKEFALDEELKPYSIKDEDDKNYFIRGFIDRFDNLESHINIIDYKSKKMKAKIDREKMEQIAELQDVQLALYVLYTSQEYNNKEYYSSLLSFKGEHSYYHFANIANIDDIKDTQYYSDEYESKLKQIIFKTKDNIENGKFGFDKSDEQMCEWCDIKNICHASILNK